MKKKKLNLQTNRREWKASMQLFTEDFDIKDIDITEPILKLMSQDLLFWAKTNNEALTLDQFWNEYNIYRTYVERWKERFPWFVNVVELAKSIIGTRREVGALKKQLDSNIVVLTAPMYNKEIKKLLKWRANLKEIEKDSETRVVIIEKFKDEIDRERKD